MQVESYELGQYVKIVDNIFSEKFMNTFHKICKELVFENSLVGGGTGTVNKKIRNSSVLTIHKYHKNLTLVHWCNFFVKKLNEAVLNHYMPIVPHMTIKPIENIQLLKYETEGFYTPHVDHFHGIPRTLSIVTFINDDYKDGCFEMFSPDNKHSQKVEPKKGRTIIFPSNFLYPHKANVVTEGTRYAMVAWCL